MTAVKTFLELNPHCIDKKCPIGTAYCISPGPTPEGGCCRITPPGPHSFRVVHRNPGHWDVVTTFGRAFRIRGGFGDVLVSEEREQLGVPPDNKWRRFKSVTAAMAWCADELMGEMA